MMKLYKYMAILGAGLVSTAVNAAVVYWEPTDGDVNLLYGGLDAGYSLGIFDLDNFDGLQDTPLYADNDGNDIITITASGSDFTATSQTTNSITLFNDAQFVIALTDGTDWFEPVSWTPQGANIYDIAFANGDVLSVDAVPTVVPVPAAVWLFGSGLLGLAGITRRKTL